MLKRKTRISYRSRKLTKIQDDYLDDLWRTIIRIRDGGLNQYALVRDGVQKPGHDAHHIFSRKIRNTRWDTRNGILVMGRHNDHDPHVHPLRFHKWLREHWFQSPIEYDTLKVRSEIIGARIDKSAMELQLTYELGDYVTLPFGWYEKSYTAKKKFLLQFRKGISCL